MSFALVTAVSAPRAGVKPIHTRRTSRATPRLIPPRAVEGASPSPAADETVAQDPGKKRRPELACPICLRPFVAGTTCACCSRTFPTTDGAVLDLCLDAGGANGTYTDPPLRKSGTALFQSDAISGIYENGWRQSFAWAGFPGEQTEWEYSMEYIRDAGCVGGILLDVSCGSGLFTRRFAGSGEFDHVVASDYSASMMKQTRAYCDENEATAKAVKDGTLSFVKADVGRLPFATGSVDAVHAGAAMHCWPSPSAAVAEISRVLRPGGVFVASTFMDPTSMLGDVFGAGAEEAAAPLSEAFIRSGVGTGGAFNQFWSERELRDLCGGMCGLENFERRRSRQFILFRVNKPV
jgi:SAM-dependent methyltransferase